MDETEVAQALETSENGLSEQEAQRRLKIHGYNELPREAFSWIPIFIRQFKNPIFAILIVAVVVSGFVGDLRQAVAILIMIALSVILGFINEYRAEKIVEDLRKNTSIKAVVTRDGNRSEIDSKLLVPGDLVSAYVGDIIPADMRILEFKNLQTNEMTLTGESFPVEKTSESLSIERPAPQQLTNYLFMGTVVVNGSGRGIVVSTGRHTEFGSISRTLARPHPETEFQRGVKKYGNMLITLTLALAVGIFSINAAIGHRVTDSLLFSLAIAVGLVPELMPAIVTISLSQGARRMAKKRVIVKRLVSIEDFGNMNILCTDKTGTLTEGKIILDDYWSISEGEDPKTLCYALLCNTAVVGEKISGNPMDVVIWEYAISKGVQESVKSYHNVDEVPFDYQRRMLSIVVRNDHECILISKGAPESVIPRCKMAETTAKNEPIDAVLNFVNRKISDLSGSGYRVLAVAYRNVDVKPSYSIEDEADLTLLGFLVFKDPPKNDAAQAITKLRDMGVEVKILSGDNELVARKLCDELKIPIKKVLNGSDLAKLNWTEFRAAVEETAVFARITP